MEGHQHQQYQASPPAPSVHQEGQAGQQHRHHQSFDEAVQSFYVALEETRASSGGGGGGPEEADASATVGWVDASLDGLHRATMDLLLPLLRDHDSSHDEGGGGGDGGEAEVRLAIGSDCHRKAREASLLCLRRVTGTSSPGDGSGGGGGSNAAVPDGGVPVQGAVAHVAELTLSLHALILPQQTTPGGGNDPVMREIAEVYATYQRRVLQDRCKPAVANLVSIRQAAQRRGRSLTDHIAESIPDDDSDHDEQGGDGNGAAAEMQRKRQPHVHVLATVLGESTSLLHPLTAWHGAASGAIHPESSGNCCSKEEGIVRLCASAARALNDEAQSLASRIGAWFVADREVPAWLDHCADRKQNGISAANGGGMDVQVLDNVILEEMAFVCQILGRYCEFVAPIEGMSSSNDDDGGGGTHHDDAAASAAGMSPLYLLLQELAGQYATLEDSLYRMSLRRATDIATPVEISDDVHVSSLVEDAFYVSRRALERASSTRNDQALVTVANRVSEAWGGGAYAGAGGPGGGVGGGGFVGIHAALERGMGSDFATSATVLQQPGGEGTRSGVIGGSYKAPPSSGNSSTFAAALLDALDEDITGGNAAAAAASASAAPPSSSAGASEAGSSSAPRSGNAPLASQLKAVQIRSDVCGMNSIASASSSCAALSSLFQEIIDARNDAVMGAMGIHVGEGEPPVLPADGTTSMLEFARDELQGHSLAYSRLLSARAVELVKQWCGSVDDVDSAAAGDATTTGRLKKSWLSSSGGGGGGNGGGVFLPRIGAAIAGQRYDLDADAFHRAEADEVLVPALLTPLRDGGGGGNPLVGEVRSRRCEPAVALRLVEALASAIAGDALEGAVLVRKRRFTDWGSLLLAKQVRLLQNELCDLLREGGGDAAGGGGGGGAVVLEKFGRIAQAVTVLQLERPSDWASMRYTVGDDGAERNLTGEEIRTVMSLRVGFSEEAVARACANLG